MKYLGLQQDSTKNDKKKYFVSSWFWRVKRHWRHNQDFLGNFYNCYSIDLLGFGEVVKPVLLDYEAKKKDSIKYSFSLWASQITSFCEK